MRFRILGPLEVASGDRVLPAGGAKQRALLAILLLSANEVVPADRLIEGLWGERPPESGRTALQVRVSQLRKTLGSTGAQIVTREPGYVIQLEEEQLDLHVFERLIGEADAAEPAIAVDKLREALSLWRGPPLADLYYESFAQPAIARLEELRLAAIEKRIDADLALGRHAALIAELEALVGEHPLRERLRAQLMLALYRADRQAEALDAYQRTRARLSEELGLEPGLRLRTLHAQILNQDPSLLPTQVPPSRHADTGEERVEPTPDLPRSLLLTSTFRFVGRLPELEMLRALMPRATGEGRRVVLLGGEAGSGKSRLAREFAAEVAEGGAVVLYGACDAFVRTPYGPIVQALDRLTRVIDPAELRTALGSSGGELTRLLPDLPSIVGDLPPPAAADPDTERHRLHTAVLGLLAAASQSRPVLLVIEDGHWADTPTLLLLRHLAHVAWTGSVLLLATFRDTDAEVPATLSETLADLRRSDDVVRLRLVGFSLAEVAEFARQAVDGDSGGDLPELARAISDLTAGNAFLVCELWRSLVETGAVEVVDGILRLTRPVSELGTPESVREVVSQRLSRLAPATGTLLELAATAGTDFELELVRQGAGLGQAELLAALDEAVASGIVEELPSRRLAYRFTHELVRRALYDRLTRIRRAELHLRVAEARESNEGRTARDLADLAHHFAAAVPLGDMGRAVEYNLLAARAATAALAYDEAAERLRTALELGITGRSERAEVLLELGTACHRAGRAVDALEAFGSAADAAHELGDSDLLAQAAIGYEDACWRPGIVDQRAVDLLEEAANALAEQSTDLRVRVLSGLARALDYRGAHARGATNRASAIALARSLQNRNGLATALIRSYWSRGTSPIEDILDMLAEAKQLGEELADTEIRADAMAWRVPAFMALCEVDSARQELAALGRIAEQTAQPFVMHIAEHFGSAIALGDGRLDEAEAKAQRSYEWGRLLTGRDVSGPHGIQMFSLRREQGRLAEIAPVVRVLAREGRVSGPWRPGLAAVLAELGMQREAKRELSQLTSEGLDPARESLWLATLSYLSDACAAVGDEATAALLYPNLAPLAGGNVMIGHLVAWYGATDRYLGMLATTLGEWDRAAEHFERALELNRRMGAITWVAHTTYQYGRMLLTRGRHERDRAAKLLGEAAAHAERAGMPTLLGHIRAVAASRQTTDLPDGLSAREAQVLRLLSEGLSNREIGSALFISEHTAANHIRSILRKTGCVNRSEASSYAHRHKLVQTRQDI